MSEIIEILQKSNFLKSDLITLLSADNEDDHIAILKKAYSIKEKILGKKVHLRGLIELSNCCNKNCYYCGIRSGNKNLMRYSLTDEEVLECAKIAKENNFSNIVLQSGEQKSKKFTERISYLISEIKKINVPEFRITLSLGEQNPETYKKWHQLGAERYLLRIESTNEELYKKIHPNNRLHSFHERLECLKSIKNSGYQTGTGVMIGLPFQSISDLADDLLFMKNFGIDMVGMGPYLIHKDTPLSKYENKILPIDKRFKLSLRMIAILRIICPTINIVSSTALQAIDVTGREQGLLAGANILMPNITPRRQREKYLLYDNKPGTDQEAEDIIQYIKKQVENIGEKLSHEEYGDSQHYIQRNNL